MQVRNHIEIRNQEGFIRGRNLKAKMVARMRLWENHSIEDVMKHYNITPAEVHAALAFYYDNHEKLDAEYQESMKLLNDGGTATSEFRDKIEERKQNTPDEDD
jgi:uncharacterized protein (DUF433 family)